ncbi:MAG TPA: hypothetical protein VN678_03345 [Acidobacteriaceae bacterium]|nr:hypothetical protein [Acidobacteriaceae bacterium]
MHRHVSGRSFRVSAAVAATGAALFLYLRNFLVHGTPFVAVGDQNQFFGRAVRILHGQVPYRDFFAFVTPGTEYLFAGGFRVFGVHAWVISAWSVITGLAFCWILTYLARQILPAALKFLPALLFVVFVYNGSPDLTHHWFSTLAALCAAAVLMPGVTLPRVAAAGMLCAAATLFTQTEGVAAFVAIAVFLLWLARWDTAKVRAPSSFVLPPMTLFLSFAGVLAVVLGLLARAAGLRSLFFDLVLFAPRYLSSMEINSTGNYLRQFPRLHNPSDLLHFVPVLFVYALVPYAYALGFLRIVRQRTALPRTLVRKLVLLHCVGIGLFLSVVNSPRLFRLTTVAAPAVLICIWLLSGPDRIAANLRRMLAAAALAFVLILPLRRQSQRHVVLALPVGRAAFTDPLSAREFGWLAARTHAGESFFNSSALALYLAQRNPTALEFINGREFTRPEWVGDALAAIERDPPHFVVLQPLDPALPRSGDHTGPIRAFVEQNYRRAAVFQLNEVVAYREEIWEHDLSSPHRLIGIAGELNEPADPSPH